MTVYWDSSCLVKLYCQERDSDVYLNFLNKQEGLIVTSSLAFSELAFAFQQKEIRGELKKGGAKILISHLHDDLKEGILTLLPLGSDVIEESIRIGALCYQQTDPFFLRTLDSLHLATAVVFKQKAIMTADTRMKEGAKRIGLKLL